MVVATVAPVEVHVLLTGYCSDTSCMFVLVLYANKEIQGEGTDGY
jgi:hypothetical protein